MSYSIKALVYKRLDGEDRKIFEKVKRYDGFDEARKETRETVMKVTREYGFPYDENGRFYPLADLLDEWGGDDVTGAWKKVDRDLCSLLNAPSYEYDETKPPLYDESDLPERYSFASDAERLYARVVADKTYCVETNVHNIKKNGCPTYSFCYYELDRKSLDELFSITVILVEWEG